LSNFQLHTHMRARARASKKKQNRSQISTTLSVLCAIASFCYSLFLYIVFLRLFAFDNLDSFAIKKFYVIFELFHIARLSYPFYLFLFPWNIKIWCLSQLSFFLTRTIFHHVTGTVDEAYSSREASIYDPNIYIYIYIYIYLLLY